MSLPRAVPRSDGLPGMGAGAIEIRRPVAPGDNVLLAGEDAAAGRRILAAGTRLRPQEIGILAALGIHRVPVGSLPRVAVLSTGDELVPVTALPAPGQIRDVNTHVPSFQRPIHNLWKANAGK